MGRMGEDEEGDKGMKGRNRPRRDYTYSRPHMTNRNILMR